MSEEINLNEGVQNTKQRFSRFANLTRNKYFNRKVIVPALILLAIPLTVGLSLVQQQSRSKAGGGLPIARVDINPGIIISSVASGENLPAPIELSALAYDDQGNAIYDGVNYDWSISSADTVGTLTKTQGVISQFLPYKGGCGVLTVTATYNGQTMTKAANIIVKQYGGGMPSCAPGANINWTTNYVSLVGNNSYIDVGTPGVGDRFMVNMKDLSYSSTPTYYVAGDQSYRTDIVGVWKENDQNMKLKMIFRYWPGQQWQLYQLQTLQRGPYERWVDYPLDRNSPTIQNYLGKSFIADNVTYNGVGSNGASGVIHFDKLSVEPFLDLSSNTNSDVIDLPNYQLKLENYSREIFVKSGSQTHFTNLRSTGAYVFSFYGYPTDEVRGINFIPSSGGTSPTYTNPQKIDIQVNPNVPTGIYKGIPKISSDINKSPYELPGVTIYVNIAPSVTPHPTTIEKQQAIMKCSGSISLTDFSTKEIPAILLTPKGEIISGKTIIWSRLESGAAYPLISPESAVTNSNGTATYIWIPQGYYGSGSNIVRASFAGDTEYYPVSCDTPVTYNVKPILSPTPTTITKKITLTPVADSFVRTSTPTVNYGTSKALETDTNPNEVSYLKFNLSSLAGKKIISASLILRVSDGSEKIQTIRRADDSIWTEKGINYNNRPKFVASINQFTAKPVNGTVSINVVNPVKTKQGTNLTLGVTSSGDDKAAYYSRESAYKPQLVIEYQ